MAHAPDLKTVSIRPISIQDAAAVLSIYEPYVTKSHVSFETELPTLEQFRARIEKVTATFPWLIAECEGKIIGFAYAAYFRERAAYAWALETSVYVAEPFQGSANRSPARILYEALFQMLRTRGTKQVIGVISMPNEKSVRFHEKMGFQTIGVFPSVGYKFNRWWDVLFVTKFLEPLPFSEPKP